jgi:hypothetical protein
LAALSAEGPAHGLSASISATGGANVNAGANGSQGSAFGVHAHTDNANSRNDLTGHAHVHNAEVVSGGIGHSVNHSHGITATTSFTKNFTSGASPIVYLNEAPQQYIILAQVQDLT